MLLNILRRLDLPRASDLSRNQLYHLVAAYVLLSLPMMVLFPIELMAIMLLTSLLKLTAIRRHWRLSRWWALPIFLLSFGMIMVNARQIGLEYVSVAFLFVFASLKLLESRESRDAFMLMLINFLLMLGVLMADDGLLTFLFVVFCFFYNLYIQLMIAQPQQAVISWGQNVKTLVQILLLSLPFVMGLFFLFPRIDPLWQQPNMSQTTTGLSDEMSPNSLSELVQDGGLAFRVKFNQAPPQPSQRYWRGPVLTWFDGRTWRRDRETMLINSLPKWQGERVDYTIYHNGSTGKWVVPLDLPAIVPHQTTLTATAELIMDASSKPRAMILSSYPNDRLTGLTAAQRQRYTTLPEEIFPQTRQLAKTLHQQSNNASEFAARLLRYFNEQPFYYDLAPPMGNASIDRFLFMNRSGYCEHYASSFAFMMRAEGIPARVVTGYQGGTMNAISEEMEIRQYSAHAWVEIYVTDQGWVRYDPTAAVAPARIRSGSPFGNARNTDRIGFAARWENQSSTYQYISLRLRAMRAFWENWIIYYDSNKQASLWKRLGLNNFGMIAWIIFVLLLAPIMGVVIWWYRRRQRLNQGDAIYQAMQRFVRNLAKHNIVKPVGMTWKIFVAEQQSQLGSAHTAAQTVIEWYYRLRYTKQTVDKADIAQLTLAIQRCKDQLRRNHSDLTG